MLASVARMFTSAAPRHFSHWLLWSSMENYLCNTDIIRRQIWQSVSQHLVWVSCRKKKEKKPSSPEVQNTATFQKHKNISHGMWNVLFPEMLFSVKHDSCNVYFYLLLLTQNPCVQWTRTLAGLSCSLKGEVWSTNSFSESYEIWKKHEKARSHEACSHIYYV